MRVSIIAVLSHRIKYGPVYHTYAVMDDAAPEQENFKLGDLVRHRYYPYSRDLQIGIVTQEATVAFPYFVQVYWNAGVVLDHEQQALQHVTSSDDQ